MNTKFFESPEGLGQLLTTYAELFTLIDDVGQQLIQGILATPDQFKEVLNTLTGAYIALEPLYSMAIAYKENAELRFYVSKKAELEGRGEKVVAASLEKEASASVEELRRVRNILEGYVCACEKGIITCQTQIRRIEQDSRFKPQE